MLHDRVGAALVGMIRRAEESQEAAARHHGMHPTDFRCIGYLLARNEPTSPRDITRYLAITSGAGTALLDRLEKAGFVRRERHPEDRRSVLIVLDEQAAAEPVALHRQISADYEQALADLSDDNLQAIAIYLERVQRLSQAMNQALYSQTAADPSDL
jgi:DNA-binding MarR family transcriptional regulator